jgi:hypothetical protein
MKKYRFFRIRMVHIAIFAWRLLLATAGLLLSLGNATGISIDHSASALAFATARVLLRPGEAPVSLTLHIGVAQRLELEGTVAH